MSYALFDKTDIETFESLCETPQDTAIAVCMLLRQVTAELQLIRGLIHETTQTIPPCKPEELSSRRAE